MDGRRDLCRDAVVRESANQADCRAGSARGDHGEIRVLSFIHLSQSIESAAKLDNLPRVAQRVERVGMYTQRDQIAGPQRATLVAEDLEGTVEISRFHAG